MSELISGKEALIALANDQEVECKNYVTGMDWSDATGLLVRSFFDPTHMWGFRLKPRTITINGIEVPAPFEPKCMEDFYVISGTHSQGWINGNPANPSLSMGNLKWRTKEDIVQVVAALREVFK